MSDTEESPEELSPEELSGEGIAQGASQMLSLAEAGRLIGRDRETIRHHTTQGTLASVRVLEGKRMVYKVRRTDLEAFAAERGMALQDSPEAVSGENLASTASESGERVSEREPSESARDTARALRQEIEPLWREYGDVRQRLGEEVARREVAQAEVQRLREELQRKESRELESGERSSERYERPGFWRRLLGE